MNDLHQITAYKVDHSFLHVILASYLVVLNFIVKHKFNNISLVQMPTSSQNMFSHNALTASIIIYVYQYNALFNWASNSLK